MGGNHKKDNNYFGCSLKMSEIYSIFNNILWIYWRIRI